MQLILVAICLDQVGMLDHLWSSIVRLGSAAEVMHARVCGVEQYTGGALELLKEHNLVDLSKGILQVL
jgi:hypothetical protein